VESYFDYPVRLPSKSILDDPEGDGQLLLAEWEGHRDWLIVFELVNILVEKQTSRLAMGPQNLCLLALDAFWVSLRNDHDGNLDLHTGVDVGDEDLLALEDTVCLFKLFLEKFFGEDGL
tara:strand:- start:325 stop:681 length:357 start_codon:yes stop_codon:yes gene_type:complete